MNLKRFSIVSAVIIGLLISIIITLACIKVDNGLEIDDPSKIIFYSKSTVGTQYNLEETPSKYNNAKKLYEEMTNLSVIDYMITGKSLKLEPSQDVNQKYDTWKESNKSGNYCVEFIYDEKQSVIVNVDGNTRVVEFYSLIMILNKSRHGHSLVMYFSTSEGTSKNYSTSPILLNAKPNGLYKLAKSLEKKS